MVLGLVLCAGLEHAGSEQRNNAPQLGDGMQAPASTSNGAPKTGVEPDPISDRMQGQLARSRNTERQRKLQVDTDKLLELATDLKQEVDKTDKNVLSVDVIKKAEQIEKLAHSVKERMKG